VTSTKFSDAVFKFAAAAVSTIKVLVQRSELVIEHAGDHVVH